MVEILALVLQHDEEAVLCAVELALEAGVATKTHVLNLLHRLIDERPTGTPEVAPPTGLALLEEPKANVARYDGLRGRKQGARHDHDPASAAIVIMMRSLKMYGMAQAVEDLIEQGSPAFEAAVPILSQLLKAEVAEREAPGRVHRRRPQRRPDRRARADTRRDGAWRPGH